MEDFYETQKYKPNYSKYEYENNITTQNDEKLFGNRIENQDNLLKNETANL